MFGAIWEAIKRLLKTLCGWFLDLLLWVIEFVYELVNEFMTWMYSFIGEKLLAVLKVVKPHIPSDLIDNILGAYQWLEYINEYVPVKLSISLLVAYYGIYLIITIYRFVKSWIPFIG